MNNRLGLAAAGLALCLSMNATADWYYCYTDMEQEDGTVVRYVSELYKPIRAARLGSRTSREYNHIGIEDIFATHLLTENPTLKPVENDRDCYGSTKRKTQASREKRIDNLPDGVNRSIQHDWKPSKTDWNAAKWVWVVCAHRLGERFAVSDVFQVRNLLWRGGLGVRRADNISKETERLWLAAVGADTDWANCPPFGTKEMATFWLMDPFWRKEHNPIRTGWTPSRRYLRNKAELLAAREAREKQERRERTWGMLANAAQSAADGVGAVKTGNTAAAQAAVMDMMVMSATGEPSARSGTGGDTRTRPSLGGSAPTGCDQMSGDTIERVKNLQLEVCSDIVKQQETYLDRRQAEVTGRGKQARARYGLQPTNQCETTFLALSTYASNISADRLCVRAVGKTGQLSDTVYACLQESSDLNTAAMEDAMRQTRQTTLPDFGCGQNDFPVVDVHAPTCRASPESCEPFNR